MQINDKLDLGLRYDTQTINLIIGLPSNSKCVNIGCNNGVMPKEIVRHHSLVQYLAFEPIKELY